MSSYHIRVPVGKYGHGSYSITYLFYVMIKNLKKYVTAVIFLFCTPGCASSYYSYRMVTTSPAERMPRKAFTLIQNVISARACMPQSDDKEKICHSGKVTTNSSGLFIGRSSIDDTIAYVLTAGHSCDTKTFKDRFDSTGVETEILAQNMTAVTYYGKSHPATIVKIESQYDMCLLQIHGISNHPRPVKVAEEGPRPGERVYNLTAPLGIFNSKMVITFEGLFAGYNEEGYALYSLPTKPGSSGSAVFNSSGEVIGMIFAGFTRIENIAITSPQSALRTFIKNNMALGEMALFSRQKIQQQLIIERLR